jgi:hypothetical protein
MKYYDLIREWVDESYENRSITAAFYVCDLHYDVGRVLSVSAYKFIYIYFKFQLENDLEPESFLTGKLKLKPGILPHRLILSRVNGKQVELMLP